MNERDAIERDSIWADWMLFLATIGAVGWTLLLLHSCQAGCPPQAPLPPQCPEAREFPKVVEVTPSTSPQVTTLPPIPTVKVEAINLPWFNGVPHSQPVQFGNPVPTYVNYSPPTQFVGTPIPVGTPVYHLPPASLPSRIGVESCVGGQCVGSSWGPVRRLGRSR